MKKLVEMMMEDLSTREVFLFRIACSSCGTEYSGKRVKFSKPASEAMRAHGRRIAEMAAQRRAEGARGQLRPA